MLSDLTPAAMMAALLVSSVGTGYVVYGRKQRRAPAFVAGILLIVEPVILHGAALMLAAAAAIMAGTWWLMRSGA